jgi:hypothetical protein
MPLVVADRVKETTTTAGTGTITLAGAVTGFQSFAAIGNGNTTYYTIAGQGTSEWEVGIGTYTSSGTTLSRTTVLASSNAGALVNFSAGTKDVFVAYPAERSSFAIGGGTSPNAILINSATVYQSCTIDSGLNGLSVGPVTLGSGVTVTVSSGQTWVVL